MYEIKVILLLSTVIEIMNSKELKKRSEAMMTLKTLKTLKTMTQTEVTSVDNDKEKSEITYSDFGIDYDYEKIKKEYLMDDFGSGDTPPMSAKDRGVVQKGKLNETEQLACKSVFAIVRYKCYPNWKSEQFLSQLNRLLPAVLLIGGTVALVCWCQCGWCCCCCPCAFCHPRLRLYNLKRFIIQNPPGLFNGQTYKPQPYEIYLHGLIRKKLFRFR